MKPAGQENPVVSQFVAQLTGTNRGLARVDVDKLQPLFLTFRVSARTPFQHLKSTFLRGSNQNPLFKRLTCPFIYSKSFLHSCGNLAISGT